jgi:hypothetical protein
VERTEVKYMPRVAVENNLEHLKQVLQSNGFDVVDLKGENVPECDCCVISGIDQNMMGMANRATDVSVVNASGLSDDEIVQEVRERTQLLQ